MDNETADMAHASAEKGDETIPMNQQRTASTIETSENLLKEHPSDKVGGTADGTNNTADDTNQS
jgi:hypothetical protein